MTKSCKICLICSPGGHLTQMWRLIDLNAFEGYSIFFVTHREENTLNMSNTYFVGNHRLKLLNYIPTIFKEIKILLKENPSIIITTGAEIAIPFCYIGKIMGKKIIYIESLSRVKSQSRTGRFIYPIADLFLVQSKLLLEKYGDKAQYWGQVL